MKVFLKKEWARTLIIVSGALLALLKVMNGNWITAGIWFLAALSNAIILHRAYKDYRGR